MQLKPIISGLFCMVCSNVLYADYDEAHLQKLFTEKTQRARIDAKRSGGYTESGIQAPTSKKIKVSGYVTRSDGKSVVWINNKNTLDSSKIGDVKVQQSNIGKNKKVGVTVGGTHVHLKPGETWSEGSGISDITK